MQERKPLNTRRGSILAGMTALTVVISLAASGFIMVSSATQTDEVGNEARRRLNYAAEAGLQMGVVFLKLNYLTNTLNQKTLSATNAISHGWKTMDDGFKDSVVIQKFYNGSPPTDSILKVVCWATSASVKSDTVKLMWAVDTAWPPDAPTPPNKSKPYMSSWTDTLLPKK